jgi:polar amino acid transport system permease protein
VSQIVIVMLGSAVCGQIATQELSYTANLIQSRNFRSFESFIVATAIYLALSVMVREALFRFGPSLFGGAGRRSPA